MIMFDVCYLKTGPSFSPVIPSSHATISFVTSKSGFAGAA
jgi:hypothetical protein